jgi:NAD(P)H dehydrogenase (quinone)
MRQERSILGVHGKHSEGAGAQEGEGDVVRHLAEGGIRVHRLLPCSGFFWQVRPGSKCARVEMQRPRIRHLGAPPGKARPLRVRPCACAQDLRNSARTARPPVTRSWRQSLSMETAVSAPKILVAFYSTYGTNHAVAEAAAEAARAAGAEVRLVRFAETAPAEVVASPGRLEGPGRPRASIPVISHADMEWAEGYFWSVPTRYGSVASQARAFIDTLGPLWLQGKLANKTFTATTSAQNTHGGQETTLIGLYTSVMHWGAIIVAPGYTDASLFAAGGNPYGFSMNAGELRRCREGRRRPSGPKRLVEMTKVASPGAVAA